ncbi:MAG: hypothetical protein ACTS1Z_06545 [Parasphingopyxis sp.]|uniref:hypothetical protein n=1 Tax=Parasphingopyxis sp. TaxID=1920299 RepID=UPI003FA11BD0
MRKGYAIAALGLLTLAACGGPNEQVYRGPDGEEVRVERDGSGTTTYRRADGETVVTTGDAGTAMPGGLPSYPGASGAGGFQMNATGRDGGSGQVSSFTTSDAPADVITFYRNALEAGGFEIAATMDMGETQMIVGERADGNGGVQISATAVPGQGTTVSVIGGEGG